jgi:hypothetical protein
MGAFTLVSVVSWLLSLSWAYPPAAYRDSAGQWPTVEQGVWSLEGTWSQSTGRFRRWKEKTRQCEDPTSLFQGLRARAGAKDACHFQATKLSESQFKVLAECTASKKGVVGVAESESVVTVKGGRMFEMNVRLHQGNRVSRATQTGRWVSACRPSSESR